MSRVLIGIGAMIVLAGIVFAVLHFSSRPQPGGVASQKGWVPVASRTVERGPVHVAGTFGAWRLLCRNSESGESPAEAPPIRKFAGAAPVSRCAVVIVMRQLGMQKAWLNLRFVNLRDGVTTIAMLAYSNNSGVPFAAGRHSAGAEVDIKADKNPFGLLTRRCSKAACFATGPLARPGVDSILAAHTLVVVLPPAKPAKAEEVHLPTDGLNAAFAALQRQPA